MVFKLMATSLLSWLMSRVRRLCISIFMTCELSVCRTWREERGERRVSVVIFPKFLVPRHPSLLNPGSGLQELDLPNPLLPKLSERICISAEDLSCGLPHYSK